MKVLKSTQASMNFWTSLPLAPIGRIAISKMLILPRFLYYFSALPVLLPKRFFSDLHKLLGELIWGPNRHRLSLAKLQIPMVQGGLAAPNYEYYYAAAQLQWPTLWLASDSSMETVQIQHQLGTVHLYTWLTSPKNRYITEASMMRTARICWQRYVKCASGMTPYSPLLPIDHVLAGYDFGAIHDISTWYDNGIMEMRDIYAEGTLMQLQELSDTYGIPQSQFLQYRAVRAILTKHWPSTPTEPSTS